MGKIYHGGWLEDCVTKNNEVAVLQIVGGRIGHNLTISDKNTGEILEDINFRPTTKDYVLRTLRDVGVVVGTVLAISKIYSLSGNQIPAQHIYNALLIGSSLATAISLAGIGLRAKFSERFNDAIDYYNLHYPTEE